MTHKQLVEMTWTELECWCSIYWAAIWCAPGYVDVLLRCRFEQERRKSMIQELREEWESK